MHTAVLLHEAIEALAIKPDGIYVDGTFGRGGHSRLILSRLGQDGRLISFDKDLDAIRVANQIEDERFEVKHGGFSQMQSLLQEAGVEQVDGILLDLGVSSPQLEQASRGFSFRLPGPLDMRMDTSQGRTAAEWLADVTEYELGSVIKDYGEERYARSIARAIVVARTRQPIVTTLQLAEIVSSVVRSRKYRRKSQQNPATRTFQAIRIFLNQELEELTVVLPQCVELMRAGARLAVISFHSLEDRIVKRFMRSAAKENTLPRDVPLREQEVKKLSDIKLKLVGKAIRASENEVESNTRARSAVMRVTEKI